MHVSVVVLSGFLAACTGDDVSFGPEAGSKDATMVDTSAPDGGDAGTPTARLLMTYSATSGELAAFGLTSQQVDGRYAMPGFGVVVSGKVTGSAYLLETGQDRVLRLDSQKPWTVRSTWSVALNDAFDGGESYADPVQLVESAANKAYVLRYNRNHIAVVDPSIDVDGGAATSSVDLSALQQANDHDGHTDISGGVYDATRQRLYVVLGNVDIYNVDPKGFFLLCADTKSTLVAIDTTNDTLVNLGGGGPGGSIVLAGYGPQTGSLGGIALDTVGDRILVFSGGCNAPTTDGGVGVLSGRLVEAVNLKTNTTSTLLDANTQDYPGVMAYLDPTHAFIQFGFGSFATTYVWDPTQPTLGAAFATAPDLFDVDPATHALLGPQSTFASDGGPGPTNVIHVALDGGVTLLGQNPFLQSGGYLGSVLLH